jgi:hypothetical protein
MSVYVCVSLTPQRHTCTYVPVQRCGIPDALASIHVYIQCVSQTTAAYINTYIHTYIHTYIYHRPCAALRHPGAFARIYVYIQCISFSRSIYLYAYMYIYLTQSLCSAAASQALSHHRVAAAAGPADPAAADGGDQQLGTTAATGEAGEVRVE